MPLDGIRAVLLLTNPYAASPQKFSRSGLPLDPEVDVESGLLPQRRFSIMAKKKKQPPIIEALQREWDARAAFVLEGYLIGIGMALVCCPGRTEQACRDALGHWCINALGQFPPKWCVERLEEFRQSVTAEKDEEYQAVAAHLAAVDFRSMVKYARKVRKEWEASPTWVSAKPPWARPESN
jgi:hypothetical protein